MRPHIHIQTKYSPGWPNVSRDQKWICLTNTKFCLQNVQWTVNAMQMIAENHFEAIKVLYPSLRHAHKFMWRWHSLMICCLHKTHSVAGQWSFGTIVCTDLIIFDKTNKRTHGIVNEKMKKTKSFTHSFDAVSFSAREHCDKSFHYLITVCRMLMFNVHLQYFFLCKRDVGSISLASEDCWSEYMQMTF